MADDTVIQFVRSVVADEARASLAELDRVSPDQRENMMAILMDRYVAQGQQSILREIAAHGSSFPIASIGADLKVECFYCGNQFMQDRNNPHGDTSIHDSTCLWLRAQHATGVK